MFGHYGRSNHIVDSTTTTTSGQSGCTSTTTTGTTTTTKKGMPATRKTETTTTTNNHDDHDTTAATTTIENKQQEQQQQQKSSSHHHRKPIKLSKLKLHKMLAALSFESMSHHLPRHLHHTNKNHHPTTTTTTISTTIHNDKDNMNNNNNNNNNHNSKKHSIEPSNACCTTISSSQSTTATNQYEESDGSVSVLLSQSNSSGNINNNKNHIQQQSQQQQNKMKKFISEPVGKGSLDSDCSSSNDLFFDAVESESQFLSLSNEEFTRNNSIVQVHRSGFETVLVDQATTKSGNEVLPVRSTESLLIEYNVSSSSSAYLDIHNSHESTSYDDGDNITGILKNNTFVTTTHYRDDSYQIDNGDDHVVQQVREDYNTVTCTHDTTSTSTSPVPIPTPQPIQIPLLPPPPPKELPLRFLRAGKNDPVVGMERYQATLQWRHDEKIDTILREPNEHFHLIKQHYPHYCHFTGHKGEPCFFEQPPKTNLKALREGGVDLNTLLRHYMMVTEYQWQYLVPDDFMTSIYVIDLDGIRMSDFVGETVDFVKKASKLSAQHYPERAGHVFVINVPVWFKMIWNVLKPLIDESTIDKIHILRGKDEIVQQLQQYIPIEHIPPEYGGYSVPLGQSQEEMTLRNFMEHNQQQQQQQQLTVATTLVTKEEVKEENNDHERKSYPCCCQNWKQCKFCSWQPPRSY